MSAQPPPGSLYANAQDDDLARSGSEEFIRLDDDGETEGGLVHDLDTTAISEQYHTLDVTESTRHAHVQAFETVKAVEAQNAALLESAGDLRDQIVKARSKLDEFSTDPRLTTVHTPTQREQQIIDMLTTLVEQHPSVLVALPRLGTSFSADLEEVRRDVRVATEKAADLCEKAGREADDLRRKLAESEQRLSAAIHTPHVRDTDAVTVASNLGKTHSAMQQLTFSSMSIDERFDWEGLETRFPAAFAQASEYTTADIRTNSQWLERFNNLSTPSTGSYSVRELAATILASAFTSYFTLGMCHLHALAQQMKACSLEHLVTPLALLQSYLTFRRDQVVVSGGQISIGRTLILLRGLELFGDYITRAVHLAEVDMVFEDLQPLIQEACSQSTLIRALNEFIRRRFRGAAAPLAEIFVETANQADVALTTGDYTVCMDVGLFICVRDSTIHVAWANQVKADHHIPLGWYMQVVIDGSLQWTSAYYPFGLESITNLRRVVPALLDHLNNGNTEITDKPTCLLHYH